MEFYLWIILNPDMNIAYLIGLLDTREKFNNMVYAGMVAAGLT
jgi:hypothetical protein